MINNGIWTFLDQFKRQIKKPFFFFFWRRRKRKKLDDLKREYNRREGFAGVWCVQCVPYEEPHSKWRRGASAQTWTN